MRAADVTRLSDNSLMPAFVILSKAKNLMDSRTYTFEILRRLRRTQNDVVGQPLTGK